MEKSKYPVEPEVKGLILGVRQIQDRGRVQIPKTVREKLKLREGDKVYWVLESGKIQVVKAVEIK